LSSVPNMCVNFQSRYITGGSTVNISIYQLFFTDERQVMAPFY
jgi:hypothetical protein